MLAAFKTWSTLAQVLVVIGTLATVAGSLWWIHHMIWTSGYDTRVTEEKLEREEAAKLAREQSVKTEKAYEKPENTLKRAKGRDVPVSPLVGAVINSLPTPSGSR